MRTLQKAIRDVIVANTIGQALTWALVNVPVLGPLLHLDAAQVAAATTVLTAALAIYRVLRDQVPILLRWDAKA